MVSASGLTIFAEPQPFDVPYSSSGYGIMGSGSNGMERERDGEERGERGGQRGSL